MFVCFFFSFSVCILAIMKIIIVFSSIQEFENFECNLIQSRPNDLLALFFTWNTLNKSRCLFFRVKSTKLFSKQKKILKFILKLFKQFRLTSIEQQRKKNNVLNNERNGNTKEEKKVGSKCLRKSVFKFRAHFFLFGVQKREIFTLAYAMFLSFQLTLSERKRKQSNGNSIFT